jgi:hypothetical protein
MKETLGQVPGKTTHSPAPRACMDHIYKVMISKTGWPQKKPKEIQKNHQGKAHRISEQFPEKKSKRRNISYCIPKR